MKRLHKGNRCASRKRLRRRLAIEALEPKRVLDASFGFISTQGGFAFQITGTDFQSATDSPAEPDNIVLWSDLGFGGRVAATNFFFEWVDLGGTWHSLSGSVSVGDIADEASDRGLQPGDFEGFMVKALGGNDLVHADGAGEIGIRTGRPPALAGGGPSGGTVISSSFLGQRLIVDGNSGNDTIHGSPEDDIIRGGADEDQLYGYQGNDIILGGTSDDQIFGGSGDDTLQGEEGRDRILGEDGNDMIFGGAGDDGVTDSANEHPKSGWGLFGGPGNDQIDGGSGADDLIGDDLAGDDLIGAAGADKLIGGSGDDSLLGDHEDKSPEGGTGTDAWQAGPTTATSGKSVTIINSDIEKIDTTGANPGEPTKSFTVAGPFGTFGPFANDDMIDSSSSVGSVQVITGDGNDILIGSSTGSDRLTSGSGNDTVAGRGGNDIIDAGTGDDVISGGPGGDNINGSFGIDVVTYNDLQIGAVTIPGSSAAVRITLGGSGLGGDAQGDRLLGLENAIGSDFGDQLFGNSVGNRLDGRGGNDSLFGNGGSDELRGDEGDDILRGGDSADALFGSKGADQLFGDGGADDLSGGKGVDTLNLPTSAATFEDHFLFGNEGVDIFQVLGVTSVNQQFLIMSELAHRESIGESDFDANEDRLDFGTLANQAPIIVSTPPTTATVGQSYTYQVVAVDPDGDALTYSLTQLPAGMTIGSTSGLIQWTPVGSQLGDNSVALKVTDTAGNFDTQLYSITVSNPS